MPDQMYTNDLLQMLAAAVQRFNQAADIAEAAGIPMTANLPFYRMGEPIRIPVSPTSQNSPFPSSGTYQTPPNCTVFRVTNNNPFAIRLKGTRSDQTFQAVSATTGWLFMPGCVEIYTTVNPILLSAMSVDGPYAASDPTQKAGTGFLELQYGTGN